MKEKRFPQALIGVAVILALAAMLLFAMSCSKLLPTAPQENQVQGYRAEDLWPAPPADANLVGWPKTCSDEASGWCTPDDGIKFELDAECFYLVFDVASDAVTEDAFIEVEATLFNYWGDDELEKGLRFEFSPDGLVFNKQKPAKVELAVEVIGAEDGEMVRLYWYNPETDLWEIDQEEKVKGEMVELDFYVSHFSRYAISE